MLAHDDTIQFAGDYNLDGIILHNHQNEGLIDTHGGVDIQKLVVELNIYEGIDKSSVTGTMVIADSINLINNLPIQGTERVSFKLATPGAHQVDHIVDFSEATGHPMHIYKLTDKRQINESTVAYTLHFCSREMVRNTRTKVSEAFSGTYEQMVAKILQDPDYLDSRKTLFFQKTRNQDKVVVPNINPFSAIGMMSKRALADDSKSAGYYFYQTTKGFHFRSWESMCVDVRGNPRTPKQIFKYMPMNVNATGDDATKIEQDYKSVEQYRFINNFHDVLFNQAAGTYGHRVITHNIYNKSYKKDDYHYHNYYAETKHADGPNPAIVNTPVDFDDKSVSDYPESRVTVMATTQFAHNEDTGTYGIDVGQDGITDASRISQRNSINSGTQLKLTIKGQSYLEPGDVIEFEYYATERKQKGELKPDPQYAGRYIISKIRHRVTNDEYVQVLECVKDSVHTKYKSYNGKSFTGKRLPREKGQSIDIMAKANPHG
jgi:hypothetical protein